MKMRVFGSNVEVKTGIVPVHVDQDIKGGNLPHSERKYEYYCGGP